jgi:hypothetical protein
MLAMNIRDQLVIRLVQAFRQTEAASGLDRAEPMNYRPKASRGVYRRGAIEVEAAQHGEKHLDELAPSRRQRWVVQWIGWRSGITHRVIDDVGPARSHERRDRVVTASSYDRGRKTFGHLVEYPRSDEHSQLRKAADVFERRVATPARWARPSR